MPWHALVCSFVLSVSPESHLLRAMHSHALGPRPPAPVPLPSNALQALRSTLESDRGAESAPPERTGMGVMYERAATDGELEEEGVEQLLELFQLSESSVFADLGSGRAEALLHVAARVKVERAIGIELLSARHQRACELREACEAQQLLKTPVVLTEGDLSDLGGEETAASHDPS